MVKYDMQSGTIKDTSRGKNRDGENDVRLLKVELSDPDDLQTAQLITQAGEDNNPPKGSRAIIISIGNAWKIAIAVDDGLEPEVEQGERKIYSSDGGAIKAYIHFKKNGDVIINGDGDNAVRFSKLKETIDEMQNSVNDLKTVFSTWVPVPQDGGAALKTAAGLWFASPLTKVIDPAKVDEIKVPS